LGYDALCGVSSCGFPNSYFSAWQLSAQLNGQDVSSLFSFDSTLGGVIYTPSVRLPEGTNNLSARVTDSIGQVSSPLNATFMIDTIAPQFLSISPPSGTAFDVPQMTLQGRVDDAQATISVSAATVAASATGPNFSFPFSLLPGSNPLTLSAKDTAGNQTSVLLNYLYQPFTVAINSPTANAVIDNNVVTVTGTFGTAQGVTVTVNGVAADVTGNSFSASNVPLAFGTNTLTVTAKTGSGATATQTVNVSSTFPAIHIDNPSAGAAFNTDRILVSGTVQGPPNSAVSVNGVVAAVSGTQFFAGNVPLDTGTAAITALVTSPTGKRASQGINVSSTGRGPVSITATPTQGIAPLIVVFNATSTGNRLVSWQANPGGPGSFDTSDPSVLFKFAYSQPGSYQAIVTVTDSTGQPYTQTLVIDVASLAQMDQTFKAIWNGMNNALLAGDKAGAMSYLTRSAKNKYGPAFDVLLPYMTGIIGSYSPLKRASISGDIGEYAVIRNDGGVNRLYFIYFSRDGDGIWRIDSM
jgi:hypothetical protein